MRQPWRLFVTGWYEMHRAGHNLWPVDGEFASDASPDAMLGIYEETDRQLGRILAALDAEPTESSCFSSRYTGWDRTGRRTTSSPKSCGA